MPPKRKKFSSYVYGSDSESEDEINFDAWKISQACKSRFNLSSGEGTSRKQKNKKGNASRNNFVPSYPILKAKFCVATFSSVIEKLDDRKKSIIKSYGFGKLLSFEKCFVPLSFATWIAQNVDVNSCNIVINEHRILIDPQSVYHILGIPLGDTDILFDCSVGKHRFCKLMESKFIPPVCYFASLLMQKSLKREMVVRCFLAVALATFLCPSSTGDVSPFYIETLCDIQSVKDRNWCKLVVDWLLKMVKKFQRSVANNSSSSIYLGGSLYYLCVLYLDHLSFDEKHSVPSSSPRIDVWKGSMIMKYSQLDRLGSGVYGKRLSLSHSTSNVHEGAGTSNHETSAVSFKDELDFIVKHSLTPQALDSISDIYSKYSASNQENNVRLAVFDVVQYFLEGLKNNEQFLNNNILLDHPDIDTQAAAKHDSDVAPSNVKASRESHVNLGVPTSSVSGQDPAPFAALVHVPDQPLPVSMMDTSGNVTEFISREPRSRSTSPDCYITKVYKPKSHETTSAHHSPSHVRKSKRKIRRRA